MLNFVESTTPNKPYFRDLKGMRGGTKLDKKITDIDGAISNSGSQPANFVKSTTMLNFVKSTTPNQAIFPRSKRTSRWNKIQTKIPDIDGAIFTSGLQPAS